MKKNLIQIAIDGPAGAGKTTVGKAVASRLGIFYLSTGRIFRSYAYALRDINCRNEQSVIDELDQFTFTFQDGNFYINGLDVSMSITSDVYSLDASVISSYPAVRKKYEKDLKEIIKKNSLVMDGRDIGTVILPDTPFKFFLDASIEVRAERRAKELGILTKGEDYRKILREIQVRDHQDTTRKVSPLIKAADATLIQSDDMTVDEVVDLIVNKVEETKKSWVWKE